MQPLKWSLLRALRKTDREKAINALRQFKPGYGHKMAQFAIDQAGQLWAKSGIAGVGPVRIDRVTWRVEQSVTDAKGPEVDQIAEIKPKRKGRPRKVSKTAAN